MKRETQKKTTRWLLPPIRRRKSSDRATVFIVIVSFEALPIPTITLSKNMMRRTLTICKSLSLFFGIFPIFLVSALK
jgi:hypothetical protein